MRQLARLRSLIRPHYGPFISNSAVLHIPEESNDENQLSITNPATGEVLCSVAKTSTVQIRKAVHNAQMAFKDGRWSRISPHIRSAVLTTIARALETRVSDFATIESMQTGRCIREMNAQMQRLPEWFDYYAALLRTRNHAFVAPTHGKVMNLVERVPLGVVAQITPFNHPLFIAVKKLAPALAAGNSVIIKPSELTPITVLELAELAANAGVPQDVLSVLPGTGDVTGREIVAHPLLQKFDITAGSETGHSLGKVVGSNLAAYTAELGGKAPILIFDDADVESAVNGAAFASFIASGQTCVSGTRIIIQSGIYDNFMSRFLEKTEYVKKNIGNPLNPRSTMGSVISFHQLNKIDRIVRARGKKAKVLAGGHRLIGKSELDQFDFSKGCFYSPTVISGVETQEDLWREEVFGPVVVVKQFSSEEEGIQLANASKYALGAGIWTQNLSRAHRVAKEIEAGVIWVNTHHRNDPSSPWGGMKESGIGRENGVEAFEAYSQSKSTIINLADAEETRDTQDWFADLSEDVRYG